MTVRLSGAILVFQLVGPGDDVATDSRGAADPTLEGRDG